jgi:hypothetical protein
MESQGIFFGQGKSGIVREFINLVRQNFRLKRIKVNLVM